MSLNFIIYVKKSLQEVLKYRHQFKILKNVHQMKQFLNTTSNSFTYQRDILQT